VLSIDEALGTWVGTEWQLTRRLLGRHTLIAGFEYRQSLRERQRDSLDLPPLIYDVNVDDRSHNIGFYGQGELALASKWLLNGGMRYDYYSNSFGGTVSPRVSLMYTPREGSTLKLMYGEAFRAPSAYERSYYPAPPGSERLEPETVSTYEVALEKYLGERDRLDLSVYHYDVDRLITQQADAEEHIYYANLARVTAEGIELEVERTFERGGLVRMSYTFQRTEDPTSGRTLTNSPRHLAKLNAGRPIRRMLDIGVELQYEGPVATLAGRRAGGFLLTHLTVASAAAWRGFRVTASIYNLFAVRYGYPGAEENAQDVIVQDGRTVHIALERRL
jgi:iron complex outermembrane receptor protein